MLTSLSRFIVTSIFCLLIFASANSYASDIAELDFRIGGCKSTLEGDWSGNASKIGLCFGFSASAHLSPRLVYHVELNYVRRGAETYLNTVPASIQLDYVEFPLLLKLQLGPNAQAIPAFLIGPYVSWMLDDHVITKFPSLENGTIVTRETDASYFGASGFDCGMVIGLAVEPIVNGRRIILGLRYSVGFRDVNYGLSNNTLSFALGFGV